MYKKSIKIGSANITKDSANIAHIEYIRIQHNINIYITLINARLGQNKLDTK